MAELPILGADAVEIAERQASYTARLKSLATQVADLAYAAAPADGIGTCHGRDFAWRAESREIDAG